MLLVEEVDHTVETMQEGSNTQLEMSELARMKGKGGRVRDKNTWMTWTSV